MSLPARFSALATPGLPEVNAPAAPSSATSTSLGLMSSLSGEDVEGCGSGSRGRIAASKVGTTIGTAGEGARLPAAGSPGRRPAASTSTESSSYHVSTSNPAEVATALGMPEAKLIGGNIVGSLRFLSSDRERRFLAEVGSSFGFPLMERRLIASGVS